MHYFHSFPAFFALQVHSVYVYVTYTYIFTQPAGYQGQDASESSRLLENHELVFKKIRCVCALQTRVSNMKVYACMRNLAVLQMHMRI